MQHVAERLGPGPVAREGGGEKEREVHTVIATSLAARSAVVKTTVPTNPPANAPQMLSVPPPR